MLWLRHRLRKQSDSFLTERRARRRDRLAIRGMIDLTKITPDEANKIECALNMLEERIFEIAQNFEELSKCVDLPINTRKTLKSNSEWWYEVYALIFKTEKGESK